MELYLGLEPFAEVPAVLAAVREAGFRTAILSNGLPAMLDTLVRRSGLEAMFDAVLSRRRRRLQDPPESLSIRARLARSRGQRHFVPILQRLGRARGLGLRHARRLVQPLRPAPRTPSRLARLRDPDARRIADAALSRRSSGRYNVARLIAAHGADAKLTELLVTLANCGKAALVQRLRPLQGEVRGLQLPSLTHPQPCYGGSQPRASMRWARKACLNPPRHFFESADRLHRIERRSEP